MKNVLLSAMALVATGCGGSDVAPMLRTAPAHAFVKPARIALVVPNAEMVTFVPRHPGHPEEQRAAIQVFDSKFMATLSAELGKQAPVAISPAVDPEALIVETELVTMDPGYLDVQRAAGRGVYAAEVANSRVVLIVRLRAPRGAGVAEYKIAHQTRPGGAARIPLDNDGERLGEDVAGLVKQLVHEP